MTTAQEYLNSGNYYRELKNYDKAINNYKKALDVLDKEIKSPKNSSMIKGIKFNITGVLVEIRDICDDHYDTAGVYMREKDWYSAIDELDMAIEEYSAINCIKEEDYFEEIDKESRGWEISILDNFAFAYDNRASCYEELGEYQKALSDMNKVIGLCPNEGYFYINRGQVLSKMEEYERAVEDYTQAIDLCSKDDSIDWSGNRRKDLIMAYVNRAYNYTNLNKYTDAVYDCTKAIELDPDNIRNHGFRAHCYQKLKQYGKAIEGYSKVIDMCDEEDNYCFNAYRDRIDCYIEIRDYNSAKLDCEYLLDNEDIYSQFAEYDTFSNIRSVYHQLKQVTENENYDYEDEDDDDDYDYDYDEENEEDLDKFYSLCNSEDFDKGIEIYT